MRQPFFATLAAMLIAMPAFADHNHCPSTAPQQVVYTDTFTHGQITYTSQALYQPCEGKRPVGNCTIVLFTSTATQPTRFPCQYECNAPGLYAPLRDEDFIGVRSLQACVWAGKESDDRKRDGFESPDGSW
jgi:hypothetical protein